jgi:hypothetical protein
MGITAVVFWFVAGVLMFVPPAPEKLGSGPAGVPASEELAVGHLPLEDKVKVDEP